MHSILYARVHATIDLHCAVEYVPVIEASRSAVLIYYRDRESICLIVRDWGTESRPSTHYIDDLLPHSPFTIQLLGMWSSFSLEVQNTKKNPCLYPTTLSSPAILHYRTWYAQWNRFTNVVEVTTSYHRTRTLNITNESRWQNLLLGKFRL